MKDYIQYPLCYSTDKENPCIHRTSVALSPGQDPKEYIKDFINKTGFILR